jgi:hypothetical protein
MNARRFYQLTFLLSGAGYIYLSYALWMQETKSHQSFCLIKSVSGMPCPSCGTTRSVISLLEGDFHASLFSWNPLGWLMMGALLVVPFLAFYDLIKKKNHLYHAYQQIEKQMKKKYFLIPFFLLMGLNWVWNLTKGL